MFDAFISYSHAGGGKLTAALQQGLHQFAKPLFKLRAIRVFRDETTLAMTPRLWPEIEKVLRNSRFFILMADPLSAQSEWVQKEIACWLEMGRTENMLIVWTGGEIAWDNAKEDFDWERTNSLPAMLAGAFKREEPFYLDLRWARDEAYLSRKDPRFANDLAKLSAAIRGRSLDEIFGEDVREQRRTIRFLWAGITVLLLATIFAGWRWWGEVLARNEIARLREQLRSARLGELQARNEIEQLREQLRQLVRGMPNEADRRIGEGILKGVVLKNELTGPPIANAEVGADFAASTTETDSSGRFTLQFPKKRPGDSVRIFAKKEGYVVVNDVQLDLALPANPEANPLQIILCKESDREEIARRYYRLKNTVATQSQQIIPSEVATIAPERFLSVLSAIVTTQWNSLRIFMRWQFPKDGAELSQALAINLGVLYFLFVFALYCIAPAKFAAWHEWIANREMPFSYNVSKLLGLFLLDTPHCLNGVVRRYQDSALKLLKQTPQFKSGPKKWVPAPLYIGDELLSDYRDPDFKSGKPYVAGLFELKNRLAVNTTHVSGQRWTISIEGPGGIGKSSLALQIAIWASDSRPLYRLAPFPMLPLLITSLGSKAEPKTVDEAAAIQLRYLLGASKESTPLIRALLLHKRVLVVVDGVSEMPQQSALSAIQPEEGAANTRALVVTSRTPTHLSNSLVARPQELTVSFLDRVLDNVVAETVGSIDVAQRKELRARVATLIEESGNESKQHQVPMLFLKLMVQKAGRLYDNHQPLDELPTTFSELVTDYTAWLLRSEPDLPLAFQQAARAARVCLGKTLKPASRSANRYVDAGLSKEALEKFVNAGLMVELGHASDPFYKFALDPIAEQLYADHIIAGIRDERADKAEIDDLMARWTEMTADFLGALLRAAIQYREELWAAHSAFSSKLWPNETTSEGLPSF